MKRDVMKQKKEENTESLELTVCAAWSDWRKRTQFRTRVSTEGMKLFTRFRLPLTPLCSSLLAPRSKQK